MFVSRQAHRQAAHECVRLHLTALAARYARAMVRGSSPRASTSFKALLFLTRVSRVSQSISEARVGLAVTQCETRFLCAPLRPSSDTHADQAQKVQPVLNFDSSAVNRSCCDTGLTRQLGGWNTFVCVYNFQCCLALSMQVLQTGAVQNVSGNLATKRRKFAAFDSCHKPVPFRIRITT